jgi:hypothetical protein
MARTPGLPRGESDRPFGFHGFSASLPPSGVGERSKRMKKGRRGVYSKCNPHAVKECFLSLRVLSEAPLLLSDEHGLLP